MFCGRMHPRQVSQVLCFPDQRAPLCSQVADELPPFMCCAGGRRRLFRAVQGLLAACDRTEND